MNSASRPDGSHPEVNPSIEELKPKIFDETRSEPAAQSMIHHEILQALDGLEFGEVKIVVREGRVVQIERLARRRQPLTKRSQ